jgi:hypothetical protein
MKIHQKHIQKQVAICLKLSCFYIMDTFHSSDGQKWLGKNHAKDIYKQDTTSLYEQNIYFTKMI